MGFKKPKSSKSQRNPLEEDDTAEQRNLDPTQLLSGGSKVSKRKAKRAQKNNDTPKTFQHLMQFMEKKKQKQQQQSDQNRTKKNGTTSGGSGNKAQGSLSIMPGESMAEFSRRVKQKMQADLQRVDKGEDVTKRRAKNSGGNATRDEDDGDEEEVVVSKRSDRKRRNDMIRKQRKLAKKRKGLDESDDDTATAGGAIQQKGKVGVPAVSEPRFGEQANAPPIFRALPKERLKKMVPLPNSKEELAEKKAREDLAVKKMIQRTARLSPLEKMQAKRKAKEQGDSAAEKRIMEAEREKAIRSYRMLRAVRESSLSAKS
ncbi:hypothetical protein GGI11_000135 [Coemansia sp. RSA 2049]|nr:hypothetical protein GGI11_000135 [Coemansia sp. RSA 2049]KAJ2668468.1 hypothetical protein GGH99_006456 [Coemansia sp. RSA 1285]